MENTVFRALALLALAYFYGIYFLKMLAQKRRGIKTNQIGRRKEKELHRVETLMSIATLAVVAAELLSVVFDMSLLPKSARISGFVIAILGDTVFLTAVIGMKDSWRAGIPEKDETKMVTDGIYAFSRNPAFLGFDLQYIGVMMMFFNVFTALFTLFAVLMLHFQILQEEKYLLATFGDEYLRYKSKTGRYFGRKK